MSKVFKKEVVETARRFDDVDLIEVAPAQRFSADRLSYRPVFDEYGFPSVNLGQNLTDYRTLESVFSFKDAAVQAGLGVIGKDGLWLNGSNSPLHNPNSATPLRGLHRGFKRPEKSTNDRFV